MDAAGSALKTIQQAQYRPHEFNNGLIYRLSSYRMPQAMGHRMSDTGEQELQQQQDLLNDSMKRIDDAYHRVAKSGGLTLSRFDILDALHESDGSTQKQACDESYTGKQTVNAAIHKMEAEGLLRFEPGGGRSLRVHLTPSGCKLADWVIGPVRQAEQGRAGGLEPRWPVPASRPHAPLRNCIGRSARPSARAL